MNLLTALERLKRPVPADARPLRLFLACGFTPLHLETFLAAHMSERCPDRRIEVSSGIFGDLAGNVQNVQREKCDALAVIVEWADLDSRLGLRTLGGWQIEKLPDIVASVERSLERLTGFLLEISRSVPTCLCLPTLPLPPVFITSTHQSNTLELSLRRRVASFAESVSSNRLLSVVSTQHLDCVSPMGNRFDLRTELTQGISYKSSHASSVAELIAALLCSPAPKKGLITDLDDTLWAGILGEVGIKGISWNLDQHSQLHGIYQQLLASFASAGVLIGVASKNDPSLVEQAFGREDLLLSKDAVFPIAAHWGQKSESVAYILKKWNILADSVVFIDDSPMEVAEVQAAFPEMECLVFPREDYSAFLSLLSHLRNRFSKAAVSEEDSLRLQSIRNSGAFLEPAAGSSNSLDDFLLQAQGRLKFHWGKSVEDARAFDLINKTSQFNLNGKRYNDADWAQFLKDTQTRLVTISYEDKFGKLGKIAVLIGRPAEKTFIVERWVMSCRAFSRRIEFHCLQHLFEKFDADNILFELQTTSRNGPLLDFLKLLVDGPVEENPQLSRSCFLGKAPKMPHHVEEVPASE